MMKTFKKIKLQDDNHLIVDYVEIVDLPDGRKVEYNDTKHTKAQLHPDLINAFKKLRVHFALISCQIPDEAVKKNMFDSLDAYGLKDLKQFVCNQVIVSGLGQERGVQLGGRRIVKQNKVINWLTPLIKLSDESTYYDYKVDLHNDLENVIEEADECLNGKYLEVTQTEIEDEQIVMNA